VQYVINFQFTEIIRIILSVAHWFYKTNGLPSKLSGLLPWIANLSCTQEDFENYFTYGIQFSQKSWLNSMYNFWGSPFNDCHTHSFFPPPSFFRLNTTAGITVFQRAVGAYHGVHGCNVFFFVVCNNTVFHIFCILSLWGGYD